MPDNDADALMMMLILIMIMILILMLMLMQTSDTNVHCFFMADADAGADGRYQRELFVILMALSIIEALDQSHPNLIPPYPKYSRTHALTNNKPIFI